MRYESLSQDEKAKPGKDIDDGTGGAEMSEERYYNRLAAAYVRGHAVKTGSPQVQKVLMNALLPDLTDGQTEQIIDAGCRADLKIYRFKTTHGEMPRIKKVLGFLKSISFDTLLDVGSGRGVFLIPFLTGFPWVAVTSADILPHRVAFLNEIAVGGISNLTAIEADICSQPLPDKSVDVVTMLEVLEHIPDVEAAVNSAVRIARNHIVVSVPSKPDDNPEHIHLLTKDKLTELFTGVGCSKLNFDGVNGHLIMIATLN
ncbi:MAG: class I SAM-dependent methyltransferase [Clostridiales bacterium]|nr:class I SAM-dependent methyltransferase [Clostridiales bacterium]